MLPTTAIRRSGGTWGGTWAGLSWGRDWLAIILRRSIMLAGARALQARPSDRGRLQMSNQHPGFAGSARGPAWRRISWTLPVFGATLLAVLAAWLFTPEPRPLADAGNGGLETALPEPPARQRIDDIIGTVPAIPAVLDPGAVVPDWPTDRPFSTLILGIDRRGDDPSGRTDTMIWLRVDPETATAVAVSVPRDICVSNCVSEPVRINAVKDLNGPDGLKHEVAQLLDQPVDYYLAVEFPGFVELVDFFGGIDIYVEKPIRDRNFPAPDDSQYEHFFLDQGLHHLDGATALKYVRTRYQDGDFGRVQRQQQFLRAVREQFVTPSLLINGPALAGRLAATFETDFPLLSLPSLTKLVLAVDPNNITSGVIDYELGMVEPTTAENGAQVLLAYPAAIQQYVLGLIENSAGQALPAADADPPTPRQELEP